MIRALKLSTLAVLSVAALHFVAPAGAATQVGQQCDSASSGPSLLAQLAVDSGDSYTVPTDGVLTRWGSNRTSFGSTSVLRAVFVRGSGSIWNVEAATGFQVAPANVDATFEARQPVKAGSVLGISSFNSSNPICSGLSSDNTTIANTSSFDPTSFPTLDTTIPGWRAAVWAIVEADADGDGYGDETQDKCPQSAAFQNPCPVLSISQQLSASKTQINVLATSSIDAQLVAVAVVSIPKIGKKKARRVTIQGTGQQFIGGTLKTIRLKLPSSVKSALKTKGKLGATVTLSGSGLANTATVTSKVTIRQK